MTDATVTPEEVAVLRARIAALEKIVIQISARCWDALGTAFVGKIANEIDVASGFKDKEG